MGLFGSLFGKSHKAKNVQLPTMSGEQSNLLKMISSGLQGPMSQGIGNLQQILSGNPEAFSKFEAPYKTEFEQQTVPGLAEMFSGIGSGSQGSSAFGQSLSSAGAGLEEQLASMHGDLQQNAMNQLANLFGVSMGAQPFQNMYTPASRSQGLIGSMLPGLAGGMGVGFGGMMGGMFGRRSGGRVAGLAE